MEHLRGKYGKHLSKDVVQWGVTVPSIWDDQAKQRMKACMHRAGLLNIGSGDDDQDSSSLPPIVVLEPEAASIYCQQLCKHLNLRADDKFLVVDIGGGTTDILVQAKVDDSNSSLKVREVSRSSGGLCGGTHVDRNFVSFLCSKIGCLERFLVKEVINPPDSGSAVCQGAVALGINKESIMSRIARKTYGIDFSPQFDARLDPPEFMEWVDGIAWCFNRIDIFMHEGSEVEVDYCTKKTYYPLKARQTTMELSLYSSSQKNPRYTTDEGTVLEGTMVVEMSKNLELEKDRKVEVSMFFGRTSIEVKAHGINFGDHKEHCMLPVNMESNWV
ncbi:unnamed protein product [Sphagnum jensenii]|uniref:Uncharacterized protein n=1 Tax=Sphagnum jensenii TaxID=128206 RepID=A0ABP0VX39_9BRYO